MLLLHRSLDTHRYIFLCLTPIHTILWHGVLFLHFFIPFYLFLYRFDLQLLRFKAIVNPATLPRSSQFFFAFHLVLFGRVYAA